MTRLRVEQPINCDPMSVKYKRFFSSAKHVARPWYPPHHPIHWVPGLRWPGLEADHSSSFTVEFQNEYNRTSTSLHASVMCTKINVLFPPNSLLAFSEVCLLFSIAYISLKYILRSSNTFAELTFRFI